MVVAYGFASKTPIGLEVDEWQSLERGVEVEWDANSPPRVTLERIFSGTPDVTVDTSDDLIWVRIGASDGGILNTVVPEFSTPRGNLRVFDQVLHTWLEGPLDKGQGPISSTPKGVVGHIYIPPGSPSIGPFEIGDASIRTILSKIVTAAPDAGLWLADGGVQRGDPLDPPLWRIVSYRQEVEYALQELEAFVEERMRIAGQKRTP